MEYILDISRTVEEQKRKKKRNVEVPGVNYGDVTGKPPTDQLAVICKRLK